MEIGNAVQEGGAKLWKVVESRGKSLRLAEDQRKFARERGSRHKGVLQCSGRWRMVALILATDLWCNEAI